MTHSFHRCYEIRTAKVWKDFKFAYDLIGHQQSVWAVLALSDEQILTGIFALNDILPDLYCIISKALLTEQSNYGNSINVFTRSPGTLTLCEDSHEC